MTNVYLIILHKHNFVEHQNTQKSIDAFNNISIYNIFLVSNNTIETNISLGTQVWKLKWTLIFIKDNTFLTKIHVINQRNDKKVIDNSKWMEHYSTLKESCDANKFD
jgi:hypothetical protein